MWGDDRQRGRGNFGENVPNKARESFMTLC